MADLEGEWKRSGLARSMGIAMPALKHSREAVNPDTAKEEGLLSYERCRENNATVGCSYRHQWV
jgi:hypothetical protein